MTDVFDKGSANGESLTRQVTLQLTPEQYERLFFQPSAPARGDLAKRLGNPTLLGTLGFLIPFTTTMMVLLQWRGSGPESFNSISGSWYFLGGIAMNIAGICEFILGNTFPFCVFIIYGSHWCNIAYTQDPIQGIIASYATASLPGNDATAFTSGQGMYNAVMSLISFCLFLGSLRTNLPFAIALLFLIPLFALLSAAEFATGYATTPEDVAHVLLLLKAGGACGFVTACAGWYLSVILACASTGVPCPLPIFDLSHLLWNRGKAADLERGRGATAHQD